MQFTELTNVSPEIIRATQAMGFTDMTEIQEKAIPLMLGGHDMIAKGAHRHRQNGGVRYPHPVQGGPRQPQAAGSRPEPHA